MKQLLALALLLPPAAFAQDTAPRTLADYLASGYRVLGFDFAKPTNSGVTMIAKGTDKGSDLRLCFIEPKTAATQQYDPNAPVIYKTTVCTPVDPKEP
jgi:hypothetical protein